MANFSLEIQGLSNLVDTFTKAGVALPGAFRRAMVASTVEIRKSAQAKVPVKTSQLRTSITEVVTDNPLIGQISVGQPYGKYVEFGTAPHIIEPKNKQALAFKIGGSMIIAKRVNHPGTQPHPFMQPALEENVGKVASFFQQAVDVVLSQIRGL